MNKKETTVSFAIVGIALLATITMVSTPTQALALGHWNLDEDYTPNRDIAEDGMDSSDTSDNTNEEGEDSGDEEGGMTATTGDEDEEEDDSEENNDNSNDKEDSSSSGYVALQDCLAGLGESPTEEEVQDCVESSYGDENDVTEDAPTDDSEDEEDEDS